MSDQGSRIGRDLSCPRCDYNLRGLAIRPVVVCPECGDGWHAASLLSDAPAARPTRLLGDVVVMTIITGECLLIAPLAFLGLDFSRSGMAPLLGVGFIVLIWLAACHAFCRHQPRYVRGVWLLAHVMLSLTLMFGGVALIPLGYRPGFRGFSMIVLMGAAVVACLLGGATIRRACRLSRRDERITQARPRETFTLPDRVQGDRSCGDG